MGGVSWLWGDLRCQPGGLPPVPWLGRLTGSDQGCDVGFLSKADLLGLAKMTASTMGSFLEEAAQTWSAHEGGTQTVGEVNGGMCDQVKLQGPNVWAATGQRGGSSKGP